MTNKERFALFSNGTEFEIWQTYNCNECVKAVFYDEKTDTYPRYRCAVQKHIDEALIGDGCGNKRTYNACRSKVCPYKQTTWYRKKRKTKDKKQLYLF